MVHRGRPDGNEFFPGNTKRAPAVHRRDRQRRVAGLPSRTRAEVAGEPASAHAQPSRGDQLPRRRRSRGTVAGTRQRSTDPPLHARSRTASTGCWTAADMANQRGREESGPEPGSGLGEQRGALPGPAEGSSRRGRAVRFLHCPSLKPFTPVEAALALSPSPRPRDNDSHGSSPRQPFQGNNRSLSAVPLNLSFLPAARSLSLALYSTEPFVCFSILAASSQLIPHPPAAASASHSHLNNPKRIQCN